MPFVHAFLDSASERPTTPYFGLRWDAPAFNHSPQVPVPVGDECLHCHELIEAGDSGTIMGVIEADNVARFGASHIECHLRTVVGDVMHLRHMCLCFGGDSHDERPFRVQAKAVLNHLLASGGRFIE